MKLKAKIFTHIYGGYTSKSWNPSPKPRNNQMDPNVFLFMIRPSLKCVELKWECKKGRRGITSDPYYGPIFGSWDIWICDGRYINTSGVIGGGCPVSFEFCDLEMFGKVSEGDYGCFGSQRKVIDFEIFSITIE